MSVCGMWGEKNASKMKNHVTIIFCRLTVVCCLLVQCTKGTILTPGQCLPDVKDRYIYGSDIPPDTKEWRLPEGKVEVLSTYALISSVLDYPRLWDYYASSHSSPVVSCENFIFSRLNSVSEFEKRKDRIQALMSYYAAVGVDCYESLSTEEQMTFDIQMKVLEVWFLRDEILLYMNATQKRRAVSLILQKHRQRQDYDDASFIALAWIMYENQYLPIVDYYQNSYLNKESTPADDDNRHILAFAENYIR
jgi:hypothetical protein